MEGYLGRESLEGFAWRLDEDVHIKGLLDGGQRDEDDSRAGELWRGQQVAESSAKKEKKLVTLGGVFTYLGPADELAHKRPGSLLETI